MQDPNHHQRDHRSQRYSGSKRKYSPKMFTELSFYVFNHQKAPVQASGFKTLGVLCCKSNPITAKFWLDRAGHVPGEKINFNAEVENLSRKNMRGSKVQIIEVTITVHNDKLAI